MKNNKYLIEIIMGGVAFAIAYLLLMSGNPTFEPAGVIMLLITLVIMSIYMFTSARDSIKDQSKKINEGIIHNIDDITCRDRNTSGYINDKLKAIDEYYDDKQIRTVISEKGIASLIIRRNYLQSGKKPLERTVTIFTAVITSVMASAIYGFTNSECHAPIDIIMGIIILVVGAILLIVVFRDEKSENIANVHDYIREYEIRKIDLVIDKFKSTNKEKKMGSSTKVDKGADIERRKKKLDEDFERVIAVASTTNKNDIIVAKTEMLPDTLHEAYELLGRLEYQLSSVNDNGKPHEKYENYINDVKEKIAGMEEHEVSIYHRATLSDDAE